MNNMRLITFGALLLLNAVALGSEFALRTFCPGDNPKQQSQRCLIGEMAKGTKLTLLGSENSKTCVTSVVDSTEYLNEVLGQRVPIAVLDPKNCIDLKFSLAHQKPETARSYRHFTMQRVADESLISKVNAAVREKSSTIETREGEHRTVLSEALPALYGIPGKPNVFVAVYQNKLIPGDETHVLYTKGTVSKIHGAANIVSAFMLGNRTYVYYRFTCNLGCGYIGDFIVEITDKGFSVVFFDASYSA